MKQAEQSDLLAHEIKERCGEEMSSGKAEPSLEKNVM